MENEGFGLCTTWLHDTAVLRWQDVVLPARAMQEVTLTCFCCKARGCCAESKKLRFVWYMSSFRWCTYHAYWCFYMLLNQLLWVLQVSYSVFKKCVFGWGKQGFWVIEVMSARHVCCKVNCCWFASKKERFVWYMSLFHGYGDAAFWYDWMLLHQPLWVLEVSCHVFKKWVFG